MCKGKAKFCYKNRKFEKGKNKSLVGNIRFTGKILNFKKAIKKYLPFHNVCNTLKIITS